MEYSLKISPIPTPPFQTCTPTAIRRRAGPPGPRGVYRVGGIAIRPGHPELAPMAVDAQEKVLIACARCGTANRVPAARLAEGPKCGKCGAPLLDGKPVALDDA